MISYLTGTIHQISPSSLTLLVNGVGYEVMCGAAILQEAKVGETLDLSIHHHIREDAQTLYGFLSSQERGLFQKFLSVNGVGPKSALAALSAAPKQELVRAIQLEDHSIFQTVSGIGPKTAKRIVIELKSKVEWDSGIELAGDESVASVRHDVKEALEQLGYKPIEIQAMMQGVELSEMSLDEAIKKMLQN